MYMYLYVYCVCIYINTSKYLLVSKCLEIRTLHRIGQDFGLGRLCGLRQITEAFLLIPTARTAELILGPDTDISCTTDSPANPFELDSSEVRLLGVSKGPHRIYRTLISLELS